MHTVHIILNISKVKSPTLQYCYIEKKVRFFNHVIHVIHVNHVNHVGHDESVYDLEIEGFIETTAENLSNIASFVVRKR
jgi:hypothetical protein